VSAVEARQRDWPWTSSNSISITRCPSTGHAIDVAIDLLADVRGQTEKPAGYTAATRNPNND